MTLSREEETNLRHYVLTIEYIEHQDERRWILLGTFAVAQGLFLAAWFSDTASRDAVQRGILALGAVLTTLAWMLALRRNDYYLDHLGQIARELERRVPIPWPGYCMIPHREDGSAVVVPGARKSSSEKFPLVKWIRAAWVIHALLEVTLILWAAGVASLVLGDASANPLAIGAVVSAVCLALLRYAVFAVREVRAAVARESQTNSTGQ